MKSIMSELNSTYPHLELLHAAKQDLVVLTRCGSDIGAGQAHPLRARIVGRTLELCTTWSRTATSVCFCIHIEIQSTTNHFLARLPRSFIYPKSTVTQQESMLGAQHTINQKWIPFSITSPCCTMHMQAKIRR